MLGSDYLALLMILIALGSCVGGIGASMWLWMLWKDDLPIWACILIQLGIIVIIPAVVLLTIYTVTWAWGGTNG